MSVLVPFDSLKSVSFAAMMLSTNVAAGYHLNGIDISTALWPYSSRARRRLRACSSAPPLIKGTWVLTTATRIFLLRGQGFHPEDCEVLWPEQQARDLRMNMGVRTHCVEIITWVKTTCFDVLKSGGVEQDFQKLPGQGVSMRGVDVKISCAHDEVFRIRCFEKQKAARGKNALCFECYPGQVSKGNVFNKMMCGYD